MFYHFCRKFREFYRETEKNGVRTCVLAPLCLQSEPIYHIGHYIREAGEFFDDGSHIIYVNASYKDDSELGKLMHDFSCTNPADMNYPVLADTARYYKEDKEGITTMCKAMEDMITDEKKEIALRMIEKGKLPLEEIAEYSDLSLEEVQKLADEELQPV